MTKKILKYTSIVLGIFVLLTIYLSTIGIETEKFNNQILNIIKQKNDKFEVSLKKIKLTLDPLNFKVNAKSIDSASSNFSYAVAISAAVAAKSSVPLASETDSTSNALLPCVLSKV